MAITIKKTEPVKRIKNFVRSMRFTTVATYLGVIFITLILMISYTLGLLSDNLYDNEYIDMFTKANIISESVSRVWSADPLVTGESFYAPVDHSLAGTNIRGVVTNTAYTVLYDTNTDAELIGKVFMRDVLKYAAAGEQAQLMEKLDTGGKMLSVAVPVKVNDNIAGCVYLAQNITSIDTTVAATRASMAVFSVLIICLIGLLGVGISSVISAPIEQFVKAAREISKGNFSIRMEGGFLNETRQMSETFNYMCGELEHLEEQRRKFVSDASHELKTPMAGIKLICDSIVNAEHIDMDTVKDFLNDMSAEVERLTRIIERLLTLTRLDSSSDKIHPKAVDVAALIDRVTAKIMPLAREKEILLHTSGANSIIKPALWDYDKIFEAVYNITDNAVKYTPAGGYVHINLRSSNAYVEISVEDNGPGIPAGEREKIFDRFYRLDDSRSRDTGGTGLGLAIAKEVILMHNGTISVNSPEKGGSVFVIRLPYNAVREEDAV